MNRLLNRVVVAGAISSSLMNVSIAAPLRDEKQASRFLYCANVTQFWYQQLAKNDPNNPGINGFREATTRFLLAAALVSDGDYLTKEKANAQKSVSDVVEQAIREGRDLMTPQAASCFDTFQKEAVPVLRAGQKPN